MTKDERRRKIGELLRITNPSQVQGDYLVPLPTHSWTDAEKEALHQLLEEKNRRIQTLESEIGRLALVEIDNERLVRQMAQFPVEFEREDDDAL
jgi:hypothetical protein